MRNPLRECPSVEGNVLLRWRKGAGDVRLPFVRGTSGAKAVLLLLTSSRLPGPSVSEDFRWSLYGYLLSVVIIIQQIGRRCIKRSLQPCNTRHKFAVTKNIKNCLSQFHSGSMFSAIMPFCLRFNALETNTPAGAASANASTADAANPIPAKIPTQMNA